LLPGIIGNRVLFVVSFRGLFTVCGAMA